MKKIALYFGLVLICFVAGFLGSFSFWHSKKEITQSNRLQGLPNKDSANAHFINQSNNSSAPINFNLASEISTPSVVYIKTTSTTPSRSFDDWFFGGFYNQPQTVINSGSGVIVSDDGYIVTNNHVIEKSTKIEVILNNKQSFEANLIGTDPSTDLALLKISAKNLSSIQFFNSNQVKIGDWVLAVGNPFNLTSTVTAGIVSAKGRNLNILNNLFPIESFIQTDAAINPGNSGGALVNINGELIGINTAIYSRTGSYNGYGFAIPSNIVSKVISDLKEHGAVQRAFVEAVIKDIDNTIIEKLGLKGAKGVYVSELESESNAKKAGLKAEDLILSIDGAPINSKAEFDEQISYRRPGEKVAFQVFRKGEKINVSLVLTNSDGNTKLVQKKEIFTSDKLGADFEAISKLERDKFKVKNGFRISNIRNGLIRRMGLRDGFTITNINKIELTDGNQVIELLENLRGNVVIEGINPDGRKTFHSFYTY